MIENVSTQLTVFHCFAHCLLPGRAFASLYALLFLEKEAEIGGRDIYWKVCYFDSMSSKYLVRKQPFFQRGSNFDIFFFFFFFFFL